MFAKRDSEERWEKTKKLTGWVLETEIFPYIPWIRALFLQEARISPPKNYLFRRKKSRGIRKKGSQLPQIMAYTLKIDFLSENQCF